MLLPTDLDATYGDDPADATAALHQQHHDEVHRRHNLAELGHYGDVLASRIVAVGHSFLTGGGATDPDRQFIALLGGMMHSDLSVFAVGGAQIGCDNMSQAGVLAQAGYNSWGGWAQVLQSWQPQRPYGPYGPTGVLPLVMYGHNDLTQHKADATGNPRAVFTTALRTVLSRLAAARVFEHTDPSVVFGGGTGWATAPDLERGGFTVHFNGSGSSRRPIAGFSGAPRSVTITLPADYNGEPVALGFTVSPNSAGIITLTGSASVVTAGGALNGAAYNLAGLAYAANGNTGDQRRDSANGHVIRVPGLVAADAGKTIIATASGVTATLLATPGQPGVGVVNGAAGATTYTYVWIEGNESGWTAQSPARNVTTGNATLDAANNITIPALGAFPAGVRWRALVRTAPAGKAGVVAVVTSNVAVTDSSQGVLMPTPAVPGTNPLAAGFSFDYWQLEAANPMVRGIVVNTPRVPGYTNGVTDADVADYNADMAAVIAEFPAGQWTLYDADAALGKQAANFNADQVHPSDKGHQLIAAGLMGTIGQVSAAMAMTEVAAQAQVMKRVSSRILVTRRYGLTVGNRDYLIGPGGGAVDAATLTLSINAEPGDDLKAFVAGMFGPEGFGCGLDFCTIDGAGNPISFFQAMDDRARATFPGLGVLSVIAAQATVVPVRGTVAYTVRADDVLTVNGVPGIVTVQLWGKAPGAGAGRTLYAGQSAASPQLQVGLDNVSRRNPGFNTS